MLIDDDDNYDYYDNIMNTHDNGRVPSYCNQLYPRDGLYYNNSQVDLLQVCNGCCNYCPCVHQGILHSKYPLLASATYKDTILGPGECIYIPRHSWHYITSIPTNQAIYYRNHGILYPQDKPIFANNINADVDIEFSFSVSFWWGKRIELKPK